MMHFTNDDNTVIIPFYGVGGYDVKNVRISRMFLLSPIPSLLTHVVIEWGRGVRPIELD